MAFVLRFHGIRIGDVATVGTFIGKATPEFSGPCLFESLAESAAAERAELLEQLDALLATL
jgi:hypothetical protein